MESAGAVIANVPILADPPVSRSPFTHLALKTEAAEARNHAVLAADAGHTWFIFHSCCRGSITERPTTLTNAQLAVSKNACPIHGHSDHLVSCSQHTWGTVVQTQESRRNTDRPPTHSLPTHSSMQLEEGIRQFTSPLCWRPLGRSAMDTDDASKEVTEAEASRKATESEAERLRRLTAAGNRSFAVHMENDEQL